MTADREKKGLTGWEKTAIVVIIILILIILILVFREQLEGYFRTFMNWYQSGN